MNLVENNYRFEVCPCCKGNDLLFHYTIELEQPTKYGSLEVVPALAPELWSCKGCKSKFVRNIVTEEDSIKLYTNSNSGERWNTPAFIDDKTPETVVILDSYLRSSDSVLDIGCNTGEFLDYAKDKGCKTYGLEYSSAGRTIAADKGHILYGSPTEFTDELFDVITAFDLMEHLYSPNEFIAKWTQHLKPNGLLIIHTGDASSQATQLAKGRWWYFRLIEHIVFPSKEWYASLLNYKLISYVPIWASQYFKKQKTGKQLIKLTRLLPGINQMFGSYTGIPALKPDHHFVVLRKE